MKAFMLDKVSEGVPAFSAFAAKVWKTLGILKPIRAAIDGHVASGVDFIATYFYPECGAGCM
jgi:hypothetical protein